MAHISETKDTNKIDNTHDANIEQNRQQVCITLMDSFGADLMNMAIKYKAKYGVGVLNINLTKSDSVASDALDIEYYKFRNISKELQARLLENIDIKDMLYFSINFHDKSYIIEKIWKI